MRIELLGSVIAPILITLIGGCSCGQSHDEQARGTGGESSGGSSGGTSGGLSAIDGGIFPGDFTTCGCFPPNDICDLGLNPGHQDCIECLSDKDCSVNSSHCTQGACVQCLQPSDCPTGLICSVVVDSTLFTCVPDCRADGGWCAGGTVCDQDSGTCFSPFRVPTCQTPLDCQFWLGEGCSGGRCGTCQSTADCPSGLTCESGGGLCNCDPNNDVCGSVSPSTPTCILIGGLFSTCGCKGNGDCPAGSTCLGSLSSGQVCVGCPLDAGTGLPTCADFSAATPVCDPASAQCVVCLTDADCLAGTYGGPLTPICLTPGSTKIGSSCGCRTAADCPAGYGCDFSNVQTGQCAPRCDLPGGKSCLDSTSAGALSSYNDELIGENPFALFCSSQTGGCQGCSSNTDCTGLYGGLAPMCLDAGFPGMVGGVCGCSTDDQCTAGQICDTLLGVVPAQEGILKGSGFCAPPCGAGDGGVSCRIMGSGSISGPFSSATVCDAHTGHCVECTSNADCVSGPDEPQLFCETDAGLCVGCLTPADCGAAYPGCVPTLGCGACVNNGDCLPGALCDLSAGFCRYRCNSSDSCSPAQPFCGDAGLCWQCLSAFDCPPVPGTGALEQCFDNVCG